MAEGNDAGGGSLTPMQITEAFHRFDLDNSGHICANELVMAMSALRRPITHEEAVRMMKDAGCGEDDMTMEKFREMMTSKYTVENDEEGCVSKMLNFWLVKRIKMVFAFCLALYTMYSLLMAFLEVSRAELRLQYEPPSERCVPFFDDVKEFADRHRNSTEVLYDYMGGDAIIRVCSDLPGAQVRQEVGDEFWYSPSADLGCDLEDPHKRSLVIANCDPPSASTCWDVVHTPPAYSGINWRHTLLKKENQTNSTVIVPECSLIIRRVPGIRPCTRSYVGSYHNKNRNLRTFLLLATFIPFIIFLVQGAILIRFACRNFPKEHHRMVAYALQGIPGPVFYLFFVCVKRKDGTILDDLITTPCQWGALTLQDIVEGLAAPVVAVYGCHLARFPKNLLLIVFKVVKMIWDAFSYWSSRKRAATREMFELTKELIATPGPGNTSMSTMMQPMNTAPYQPMMAPPQQQPPVPHQQHQHHHQYQQPPHQPPQQPHFQPQPPAGSPMMPPPHQHHHHHHHHHQQQYPTGHGGHMNDGSYGML